VNTDNTLIGECRNTTLSLPQGLIDCNENQHMRLTLNSFAMRNSWYRLNRYNTVFYVVAKSNTGVVTFARIKIPEGNYTSFTSSSGLCKAIEDALDEALKNTFNVTAPASQVTWDFLTNILTITFNVTGSPAGSLDEVKLVTFTINNYSSSLNSLIQRIIGRNQGDAYQNCFEVMGGCFERRTYLEGTDAEQFDQLTSMFSGTKVAPNFTFTGSFNATLQTEENIYLRTDLHSTSYQTSGFDTGSSNFPNIVSSQILAKIPLNNPTFAYVEEKDGADLHEYRYERPYEIVYFQDNGNNMYSLMLNSKKVAQMRLAVTDSYGRLIPEISKEQIDCNALSFTASLRVDVFEDVL
jgi:hypothetical protein